MKCGFCIVCDKPCFGDKCNICAKKEKLNLDRINREKMMQSGVIEKIKEGHCYLYEDKLSERLEELGEKYYNVSKYKW